MSTPGEPQALAGVDHERLFRVLPTAQLLLDRDLVVVDANDAYLAAVGRTLADLVGRPAAEALPGAPGRARPHEVARACASLARVRQTGRPDAVPMVEVAPSGPGGAAERHWSLVSEPVVDGDGRVALVLQRAEDATDLVRRQALAAADTATRPAATGSALEAEEVAGRRPATLAEVALLMVGAQSVDQLTGVVFGAGLPVLEASAAALAVRTPDSDVLDVVLTDAGAPGRRTRDALPVGGPLPPSAAARGTLVLVPDERAAAGAPGVLGPAVVATASLPLQVGSRLLGSLTVGWPAARRFPPAEVELLRAFAAQCALALDRLAVRQAERRAALRSHRMSETLQRSLLTPPPRIEGLQIGVRYQPAAELSVVGGDWYDAFVTPDGSTSLVIGDVAGHDRDAAAAMGQVRNVLRGVAQALGKPPAAVLTGLDEALHRLALDLLATVALVTVDRAHHLLPGRGRRWKALWSNAGHPPPLLVRADGSAELLFRDSDLLVGLDPSTGRHDHAVHLSEGDVLVLYTDGLVERRGERLDASLEQLRAAAEQVGAADAEEWCDALLARVGDDPQDDIALLVVRAQPEG
jgi:serine phosphatase RsbU (regulator of sigma subunit)